MQAELREVVPELLEQRPSPLKNGQRLLRPVVLRQEQGENGKRLALTTELLPREVPGTPSETSPWGVSAAGSSYQALRTPRGHRNAFRRPAWTC
jgi:hypothetical protein